MHDAVARPPNESQIDSDAARERFAALTQAIDAHDRLQTPASRDLLEFARRAYLSAAVGERLILLLLRGKRA